jgi:hypothetical protein
MSAYPPKADIDRTRRDVCFAKSRHSGCFWILLLVGKGAQVRGASPVILPRRQFLRLGAGAASLTAVSRIAWAQNYPTRPVRIIVATAPGGLPDILARLIGPWLSARLGQQFVIENRPGAGSGAGSVRHRVTDN